MNIEDARLFMTIAGTLKTALVHIEQACQDDLCRGLAQEAQEKRRYKFPPTQEPRLTHGSTPIGPAGRYVVYFAPTPDKPRPFSETAKWSGVYWERFIEGDGLRSLHNVVASFGPIPCYVDAVESLT